MTFYVQTYPFARPARRLVRRWAENQAPSLPFNIREDDDAFVLSAPVPGLKAEDLNVQVLDDILRIEGQYPVEEQAYLLRELPQGGFSRTLRLPVAIEADQVEAKITDGILTLRLPKAETARPKRIQVKLK